MHCACVAYVYAHAMLAAPVNQYRGEIYEYRQDILSAIQECKIPKPTYSGHLPLNASLGFPDFEPATSGVDEIVATYRYISSY